MPNKAGHNVEELGRTTIPVIGHVIIIYDVWQGEVPKDDPSVEIKRRAALFTPDDPEKIPPEGKLQESVDEMIDNERSRRNRYYGWRYWDGLEHSVFDEEIETTKAADKDAVRFREEHEQAQKSGRRYDYTTNEYVYDQSLYDLFLGALDTIAKDPEDEEAWEAVRKYRADRLAASERGAKNV